MSNDKLAQALREVLATLKRENERAEGPITDTIWRGPAETLFDFIENTLGAHEAEEQADRGAFIEGYEAAQRDAEQCDLPPLGWRCTRKAGHEGPCAAVEATEDVELVAKGMARLREAEKQAGPVALGYMNAGHLHEMQQGRLPYGYVYAEEGPGAHVAVFLAPPSESAQAEQAGPVAVQSPAPAHAALTEDALTDLIAENMTAVYHCTRVWYAWHVGTMSQDDFEPYADSDSPRELAAVILAAIAATQCAAVAHGTPPSPLAEQDKVDAELDARRYRLLRDFDSADTELAICRWSEHGWCGEWVIEHDPDTEVDKAIAKREAR